jgi:two-component system response regulator FlrC
MSEKLSILVVEDDDALRDALQLTLESAGHEVTGADGGPAALEALRQKTFNMVVSDLRMSPMDGLVLLGEIRGRHPGLPVLLMTAFGDVDKAVAAMRGGACDFMLKPFEPKALIEQIARYATPPAPAAGVVAVDARTRATLLLAARVARTDATVLLTGESGVGKEVFARYIHEQSVRAKGPFVAINCAAIPDNLLEATLFGYEKGAFTGAQTAQAGKFEQANGGTLLLVKWNAWGARSRYRSTSVSWRPPTGTWRPKSVPVGFAKTCSTASTCFRSRFPPCGNVPAISCRWRA